MKKDNILFLAKSFLSTFLGFALGWIIIGTFFPCIVYTPQTIRPYNYPHVQEKRKIVMEGDTAAYHFVVDSIVNDPNVPYPNYLYYSYVMANKHNYALANYDVYKALLDICDSMNFQNEKINSMALFYLRRGASLGDVRAKEELNNRK